MNYSTRISQQEDSRLRWLSEENRVLLKNERDLRRSMEDSVQILREERELRERFVSALTHDLRTPMTAAKMTAQLLEKKL